MGREREKVNKRYVKIQNTRERKSETSWVKKRRKKQIKERIKKRKL